MRQFKLLERQLARVLKDGETYMLIADVHALLITSVSRNSAATKTLSDLQPFAPVVGKAWHIKKDPASCLAGEGGMVEEIVCRSSLQTPPKVHRFKERSRNWGTPNFTRPKGGRHEPVLAYPTC